MKKKTKIKFLQKHKKMKVFNKKFRKKKNKLF